MALLLTLKKALPLLKIVLLLLPKMAEDGAVAAEEKSYK
jgi:hypothetical protein